MKIQLFLVVVFAMCVFSEECRSANECCNDSRQCCSRYCKSKTLKCGSFSTPNEDPCAVVRCREACIVEDRLKEDGKYKPTAVCVSAYEN